MPHFSPHPADTNPYAPTCAAAVLRFLRLSVIGLIAAAALGLMTTESFGVPGLNLRFGVSLLIFVAVFLLSLWRKASPIVLIFAPGLVGLLAYSL